MIHYVFVSVPWEYSLQRPEPAAWFTLGAFIVFPDEKLIYTLLSNLSTDKMDKERFAGLHPLDPLLFLVTVVQQLN